MGLGRASAIACRLVDRGWSRGTPAAVIVDATRPEQQVWRGTLDALAVDEAVIDAAGAGTIVIGHVAALALRQLDEPGAGVGAGDGAERAPVAR